MKNIFLILFLFPIVAMGQLELPYSIKMVNPKPVDFFYYESDGTPWDNTTEVTTTIISGLRYQGMTVNIAGLEYWFRSGIADVDLVVKLPTFGNGFTTSGSTATLGGTLTGNVAFAGNATYDFSVGSNFSQRVDDFNVNANRFKFDFTATGGNEFTMDANTFRIISSGSSAANINANGTGQILNITSTGGGSGGIVHLYGNNGVVVHGKFTVDATYGSGASEIKFQGTPYWRDIPQTVSAPYFLSYSAESGDGEIYYAEFEDGNGTRYSGTGYHWGGTIFDDITINGDGSYGINFQNITEFKTNGVVTINGGTVILNDLPTSDSGLESGQLWVDPSADNVLKVVP